MDNTKLYLSHYANNLDRDLLLFPLKGIFVNLSTYLITFNNIVDTSNLKTILEYYGYQQLNAFKIGDTQMFERIRNQMDVIIDSMWSNGKTRLGTINNDSVSSDKNNQIYLEEQKIAPTKSSAIYIPTAFNTDKYNIRYGSISSLYRAERKYVNDMNILISHEFSKQRFMDLFNDFDSTRTDALKSSNLNHTLFSTNKIQNIDILNSLQNSIITKDFNPTTLIVFSPYSVRQANLLAGLFTAKSTEEHEVAMHYLHSLKSYQRNAIIPNALIELGASARRSDLLYSFLASRDMRPGVVDYLLFANDKYNRNMHKDNIFFSSRGNVQSELFIKYQLDKIMLLNKTKMNWLDSSTSSEGFIPGFGGYGDRYAKPVIDETNFKWGSISHTVLAKLFDSIYFTSHGNNFINLDISNNFGYRPISHDMTKTGILKDIAYKMKYTAIGGMYEYSRRIERIATEMESFFKATKDNKDTDNLVLQFNTHLKYTDSTPVEFATKLKYGSELDIQFSDKLKPMTVPRFDGADIFKELTLPDIEFMHKSLNTEILLFSTLEGKLNKKECSLTGVLLETAQWLTSRNIYLKYSDDILVDRNHSKDIKENLTYKPLERITQHPGGIRTTDKKMEKQKEAETDSNFFSEKIGTNQMIVHDDGSAGGLRYQKQVQSTDEMFGVTPHDKQGQRVEEMFTASTSNKEGGAVSEPFIYGDTSHKEGGAVSEPFIYGSANSKEGGAVSEPFILGTTNSKEGGAVSDPFTLSEKSLSKEGSQLTDSLWTDVIGKYGAMHGTYTTMDNCLKVCVQIYDYLCTTRGDKPFFNESFNFTWCSINSKSSMIHDHQVWTDRSLKDGQSVATEFLTTKQRMELFKVSEKTDFVKPDSDIIVKNATGEISKQDSDLTIDDTLLQPIKQDREITIEERKHMTTKQLRDLFLAEQQIKVEKKDDDIILLDNITDLEKLGSDILIDSMSYVIEKNPADITMGDIYMLLKSKTDIYIPLNTSIPMEQAYKTITLLNDIISVDKNFAEVYLNDIKMLYKAKPDILILDKDSNGSPFDKWEKNVILNSSVDVPYSKDDRDILLIDTLIPTDILKRWYFLPDEGPYDRLVLPLDYPYKEHPIKGVVTVDSDGSSYPFTAKDLRQTASEHPMPNGWNDGTEEIDVSIAIMANVIDLGYVFKETYKHVYDRYTPSQAIKHFVNLYYEWLDEQVPTISYHVPGYVMTNDANNPETFRADYWRLYRWIRWHAEAIIQNLSDSELNILGGTNHIDLLLNELIRYFNDHHGIYAKDGKYTLDKVKGVRHRWLSRYNKF